MNGNSYGTFGQPNQWRLDMDLTKLHEEYSRNKDDEESEEDGSKNIDDESHEELSQDLDSLSTMTDEEMLTRRSNVWETTSIGNTF
jgi:hypothetical protein